MAILTFLLNLSGAIMLLLFAVRMVRTGIERSVGASFQRWLTESTSLIGSGATGIMLALILQSSAAVALLTSGFAAAGYLAFPAGLAVVLGGDLGSALIIQVLSFRLDWLIPLLLTVGGFLFVKTEGRRWRQAGRILMGIAFILISLQLLRQTMEPIKDSAFLPAIAQYLARDFITAFLVGAALAFIMHSSVAAVLMCVTLVHIDAIPFAAGLSLVLGANLGSAAIPVYLTRGMDLEGRRIPIANMMLRGTWALAALLVINLGFDPSHLLIVSPGQSLIYAHIAFNLSLLIVALPLCRPLGYLMLAMLPSRVHAAPDRHDEISVLDHGALEAPQMAIASLKRELLRMMGLVERMFEPIQSLYDSGDKVGMRAVKLQDKAVNAALLDIRRYVAAIPIEAYSKGEAKTVRSLMEYAIRLEAAGDLLAGQFLRTAAEKSDQQITLSAEGWAELVHMFEAVRANFRLAGNVLISDDLESARLLVMEKTEIKQEERRSRKRHLQRLSDGRADSFQSSDVHLETLRALRDLNGHISAVAYPILYRNGQLLETRLIRNIQDEAED
ncbi:Na/Pi cotransporter family protein [Roseovarius sp. M141]|uniref:Na/Pi cotransporter family protein n=1 Tax=Roseovarius sp. M141 TaxID=2583806 RepID=UPI0020CE00E2|nr:Na/Pi cotransporter family protein [Roseovarius sp. M141]MCQ0094192.1 Na/Pi cotransporter family protein [Roseovarius sp. M141]